jgi:hypothetical protein
VLVVGYIESRVLRELRYLTPHRDVYEFGRSIPTKPEDTNQFITSLFGAEDLSTCQPPMRRSLILAPNVESGIVDTLLQFKKAWVASCVAIPQQEKVQKSNVAIYDVNSGKWFNIDKSEIDTKWCTTIIQEAMTKSNDELLQAYLDFAVRTLSNKASALYRYVCGGVNNQVEIWADLGEPTTEERKAITCLCKAEFNIDVTQLLQTAKSTTKEIAAPRRERPRNRDINQSQMVEKLVTRMALEEKRIRECLEDAKSRLQL